MYRHLILPLTVALIAIADAYGEATFNVATYNIRNLNTADTGQNYWDNRKEALTRLVRDYEFDIVGFQEVRYGPQFDDLHTLMPEYQFVGWACDNYSVAADCNLIAFLPTKFTLIETDWFFLGHDDKSWTIPWDNSTAVRHTSWAKLQHNDTGEVFYVFCTHLDHQGNTARAMQAQKNIDYMWQIAGDHPILALGDFNSQTSRKNVYDLYNAYFLDSFLQVSDYGASYEGTCNQWDDDPSIWYRIDYIWSRHFAVNSYRHITEKYDRDYVPSDHLPVVSNVTLESRDLSKSSIYVNPSASSSGDGSRERPFKSIPDALKIAYPADTIKVTEGQIDLTAAITITSSVRIIGGYNVDFSEIVGKTTLNATKSEKRIIYVTSETAGVEFCNLRLVNAYKSGNGGGLNSQGVQTILRDCEFVNCSTGKNGGAIFAEGQLLLYNTTFDNCTANNGGAFYCDSANKRYWWNYTVNGCYFHDCTATEASVGNIQRFIYGWIANNTFAGNIASSGSTLYLQATASNELGTNLNVFNNSFADNTASRGAAMYIDIEDTASASIVCNTIVGNRCTSANEAAVNIAHGIPYMYNNIIAGNVGSDVYVSGGDYAGGYNVFTTEESVNLNGASSDFFAPSFEQCLDGLSVMLRGEVAEGEFVPQFETLDYGCQVDYSDPDSALPDAKSQLLAPVIPMANPNYLGNDLRCVPISALGEISTDCDFNFDADQLASTFLATDQLGFARPTGGNATVGAVECISQFASLMPTIVDSFDNVDSNAPIIHYDALGRIIPANVSGFHIMRQGNTVRKSIIK